MSFVSQLSDVDPTEITFDDILSGEHGFKKVTLFSVLNYIHMLVLMFLQFAFLASDVYTLIAIYALNNWSDYHAISYVPAIAYKITFTVCIGISMAWLIITWIYGIHVYKSNRVTNTYLDEVARHLQSIKSFERFCIYQLIDTKSLFDWWVITVYQSWHFSIYVWLFADTPRQVLNGATIAFSISNSFTTSNIAEIVKNIAKNNRNEAVLLSFMTFSFLVWVVFTIKYLAVLFSTACIRSTVHSTQRLSFKRYTRQLVSDAVLELYETQEKKYRLEMKLNRKVPIVDQESLIPSSLGTLKDKYDIPVTTTSDIDRHITKVSASSSEDASYHISPPTRVTDLAPFPRGTDSRTARTRDDRNANPFEVSPLTSPTVPDTETFNEYESPSLSSVGNENPFGSIYDRSIGLGSLGLRNYSSMSVDQSTQYPINYDRQNIPPSTSKIENDINVDARRSSERELKEISSYHSAGLDGNPFKFGH